MKFTVERDNLLVAIQFVSRYVEQRSQIPVLACVRLDADDAGVTVTGTDLGQSAQDRFAAHVHRPGSVCIDGATLAKVIKTTDASEVQIDADEAHAAVQIGGKVRMRLPVISARDFPEIRNIAAEAPCNFTMDASLLDRIAAEVSFAQCKDKTRYYLCGTHWTMHGNALDVVATDGHRLSLLTIDAPTADIPSIIIPPINLPDWSGEVAVSASSTFVRFVCGRQVVASQLVDGTFPDYRRIIPKNPTTLLFDRDELASAINRMSLVTSGLVLFVGRDGKVSVSAVDASDNREISEEIAFDGDDFQVSLAPNIIGPVLGSFDCETIEWRWGGHETAVTLRAPKDKERLAVVMPVRDARITPYLPNTPANLAAA